MQNEWADEAARSTPTLWRPLARMFGRPMLLCTMWVLLRTVATYAAAYVGGVQSLGTRCSLTYRCVWVLGLVCMAESRWALKLLITFLSEGDAPLSQGIGYVLLLMGANIVSIVADVRGHTLQCHGSRCSASTHRVLGLLCAALCVCVRVCVCVCVCVAVCVWLCVQTHMGAASNIVGMHARTSIVTLIYNKLLTVHGNTNKGKVLTLLSVDANRIQCVLLGGSWLQASAVGVVCDVVC